MKTKDKDIRTKSPIKTICTTLACLVTAGAFALDDRNEPKPEPEEPGDHETPRPDLVPLGLKLVHDPSWDDVDPERFEYALSFRRFNATITVANFGKATAMHYEGKQISFIECNVGFKVLATNDPVKYPVGHTEYASTSAIIELKPLDIVDVDDHFAIPKSITAVEFFVTVDRRIDLAWYNGQDSMGTWTDDFGAEYIGDIAESKEDNNVLGGFVYHFAEILRPTVELPPVVKSGLTVRKK